MEVLMSEGNVHDVCFAELGWRCFTFFAYIPCRSLYTKNHIFLTVFHAMQVIDQDLIVLELDRPEYRVEIAASSLTANRPLPLCAQQKARVCWRGESLERVCTMIATRTY